LNQTPERDSLINESEIEKTEQEEEEDIPEWRQVLEMLEFQFGPRNQFISLLQPLRPLSYDGAVLVMATPNTYVSDLLNARLAHTASNMLSGILGRAGMMVTFVAEESRQSSVFSKSRQVSAKS
jgi:hypothetical protein